MQETTSPLVTIAIPNYNMGHYIEDAIESALSQTFTNFEIVIVNNASTDNSWDLITTWAAKDKRIVPYNYKEHAYPIQNWNRCLEQARGRYIVYLHADDKLNPNFLKACLEIYDHSPELGYVFTEKEFIDANGQVSNAPQFYKESGIIPGLEEARVNLLGWHTAPVQMLIRTDCMREIGGYEFSDSLLVLLSNLSWDVGYVATPLVQYRKHEESSSSQNIKDKTLIQALYLTKMLTLSVFLPPNAYYLRDLKPQILERTAHSCLASYSLEVLGRNEHQLCREYMCLAKSFWLDIEETELHRFLETACKQETWTPETLNESWSKASTNNTQAGAPYPLPQGSVPFHGGF